MHHYIPCDNVKSAYWLDVPAAGTTKANTGRRCVLAQWITWRIYTFPTINKLFWSSFETRPRSITIKPAPRSASHLRFISLLKEIWINWLYSHMSCRNYIYGGLPVSNIRGSGGICECEKLMWNSVYVEQVTDFVLLLFYHCLGRPKLLRVVKDLVPVFEATILKGTKITNSLHKIVLF